MRFTLLVSLLLATPLAAVTEAPHDLGITEDALVADEECPTNASPGCALNALQLRVQKTAVADEAVAKASASAEEMDFAGASANAHEDGLVEEVAPGVFVELDQSAEAEEGNRFLSRRRSPEESEDDRRRGGTQRRRGSSNRRRSSKSRNMCCKCRSGTVSWSQSGTCSHCQQSGILKSVKPPAKCQQGSSSWKGQSSPTYCANECGKLLNSGYHTATGGSGPHLGSSSGAGCNNKTGGSCRFLGCAKSRGGKAGVKCVKGKCVCQAGYCASGGKCTPR